jgi:hypothetical protein
VNDGSAYKTVHTYESAGFNGFFRRSIGSPGGLTTLRALSSGSSSSRQLNFDDQQISGAMGDALRIGTIYLDGKTGRIKIHDEQGNEVVRLGDIDD